MNIIEALQELEITYWEDGHEHCRQGWVQIDCPDCSPDWGHARLGINIQGLYCNCYYCGPKYLKSVLYDALPPGASYSESQEILSQLSAEYETAESDPRLKRSLVLPNGIGEMHQAHTNYLISRGFTYHDLDILQRLWQMQGITLSVNLSWRIFIPIHYKGEVVSWTTRSISEVGRYRSASADQERIPHKELLYGEDYARHSILVFEGIIDVWKIGPGAVATFGTGFSRHQVLKLSKYPKRMICFDAEIEAQKRAGDLADQLESFPGETSVIELQTGKDAASCSNKEVKQLKKLLR